MKSQREETISSQVLAHAAEEIRHAQTFKRLALKMSDGELDSYAEDHLLCGVQARQYMQAVDHEIAAVLNGTDGWVNYLLTTLLVEERAGLIYPHYDSILTELGYPAALQGIVREETMHLEQIRAELGGIKSIAPERLKRLREFETSYSKRGCIRLRDFLLWRLQKIELTFLAAEVQRVIRSKNHVPGFGARKPFSTARIRYLLFGIHGLDLLFDLSEIREMRHALPKAKPAPAACMPSLAQSMGYDRL